VYEFIAREPPFRGSWDISTYATGPIESFRSVPFATATSYPPFFESHITDNVRRLLARAPQDRPSAAESRKVFEFHCQFLSLENVQKIIPVTKYLSYDDWKAIAERHESSRNERLYTLVNTLAKIGEHSAANSLKRRLVLQDAKRIFERKRAEGFGGSLTDCAADVLTEKKDYAGAIAIYNEAIEREPENFWLWHGMYRVHMEHRGVENAITRCRAAVIDTVSSGTRNLPCLLELGCLYAVAGEFEKSMATFDLFLEHCKYIAQIGDLRHTVSAKTKIDIPETRYLNPYLCSQRSISPIEVSYAVRRVVSAKTSLPSTLLMTLNLAAWSGNLHAVQGIFGKKDPPKGDQPTPLHLAAANGHLQVMDFLLQQNEASDWLEREWLTGFTPLSIAAGCNDSGMVTLLLDAGAALNTARVGDNGSPLGSAAFAGNLTVMKLLLERGANPSDTRIGESGAAIIHLAAAGGYADAIAILQAAGASINAEMAGAGGDDASSFSPIHAAAKYGQPDTVRALLASGANVNSVHDMDGWTPLHHSCGKQRRADMLDKTLEKLQIAAELVPFKCVPNQDETVKVLIEAGANVSARTKTGELPIFRAAAYGRLDAVKLLLDGGADVSARSNTGQTTLFWAARKGKVEAITFLISVGASVKAKDDGGRTAIFLASEYNHVKAIEKLHELGADLSARDDKGCTPLFYAARCLHTTAVQKLIELGADSSCKNYAGDTPWLFTKRRNPGINIPPELEAALGSQRASSPASRLRNLTLLGRKNK